MFARAFVCVFALAVCVPAFGGGVARSGGVGGGVGGGNGGGDGGGVGGGNGGGVGFEHWESPHGHPLDMTPDGQLLLAVNTHDARLEVFSLATGSPVHTASIPVGLEPVSVRARTNTQAWVVNHISDSVSIVDLSQGVVVETIWTDDEPMDVVFAGSPERAFVSVSQRNELRVFDPASPLSPPSVINIEGEDPRALATDGSNVYLAIFESGNKTTILSATDVSSAGNPYPGDQNPPPNDGSSFDPPIAPGLPTPPEVGMIVRKNTQGIWQDDNARNWSGLVDWDLHDHDLAIIDADSLAVSYETGLMNANMALGVRADGFITVVGTDATNEVRFEPVLNGTFVRVNMAGVNPNAPGSKFIKDLNPHLNYSSPTIPQTQRDLSIGDPRGIVWNEFGTTGYITGMGSNNVIVIDSFGNRLDEVDVPAGPTGIVLDQARQKLYVLSKFDSSITTIPLGTLAAASPLGFFDPAPEVVAQGRRHLYDTHETSGLGQASCASCHIDARMDQLSWDLGNPSGEMKDFNQTCDIAGACEDWHPMKGPMATQTLVGIVGNGPMHWRGDKEDLAAFNPTYEHLQGDDEQLTPEQMAQFEAFISTIRFPPNPNLQFDGSFAPLLPNGGDPANGRFLFENEQLFGSSISCAACHMNSTGTDQKIVASILIQGPQSIKTPHLRNQYEKTGFDVLSNSNNRGFGYTKDGAFDNIHDFLNSSRFSFDPGPGGLQQQLDVEAYVLSFPTGTHASVGSQTTVKASMPPSEQTDHISAMLALADADTVDVIAKGLVAGEHRGFAYTGSGQWQSDRANETLTSAQLLALAGPASPITYTVVLEGAGTRMGIDRDEDGFLDTDELDRGTDPVDPDSFPTSACDGDANGDGSVDVNDVSYVLFRLGGPAPDGDANQDGTVDVNDISYVLFRLGGPC